MSLAGKTIIVTGASGLIGAATVAHLKNLGARVISAVRDTSRAVGESVHYDAEKPVEFGFRADMIVHAACSAHPMAYATNPAGVMRANITGTMNLLDYARDTGARLLFLSSGEIYGNDPLRETGFTEDETGKIDPMNPRSCYPESKRAAETMVAAWASQYGADALVARFCHVYGGNISPSNTRADAQFLRRAKAGQDIIMKSDGAQVRSFLYAKDAAAAIALLLEKGEAGAAYNAANRHSVHSIREYAETMARLAGVKVVFDIPDVVEKSGYSRVSRAVLDPARIEKLGFSPRYTLEAGLRETLEL